MNRAHAKKLVLSQLASYPRREVIIDGVVEENDLKVLEDAQADLIAEFTRRGAGAELPERFNT